jgi:hypothetical protein
VHTFDKVLEPDSWLRQQAKASPRNHQEPIKLVQQNVATSPVIEELLSLGVPDSALDAAPVKAAEYRLSRRGEIKRMQPE